MILNSYKHLAASCILIFFAQVATAQVPCGGYEVTAIVSMEKCPPFGIPPVLPLGLNEQGWMVGYFNPCVIGANRAWLWTPEDGLVMIPTPAGTNTSRALAISGSKIVGYHVISGDEFGNLAFIYDYATDEFTSLGSLPGGNWSEARGINALGQISGFWGNNVTGFWNAFIWEKGEMIDIGPSIGEADSRGLDINDSGAITGWTGIGNIIDSHAFIWDHGRVTELTFIPGGFTSEGVAINDRLDVAGRGRFFDRELNTTVWRAFALIDGKAINLGTIPGFDNSLATGINDDQIIVGFSQTTSSRAFVWREGEMTAFNDLISPSENLDILTARDINQTGQIACSAVNQFNDTITVLLTPIERSFGDLDNDCQVGVSDLLILFSSWGSCDSCATCPADLDTNCTVGVSDLLLLFANWG